ncbi:MAG: tRNA pseudouridine(55) synthase TruB [Bilifractor sp.]|jgi:tRNA pseudouridine55 synthase
MLNGIINVYKEAGWTSFDVIAKLRGIAGQKKLGHTGTLDPDAEGVLPVCLGRATKLCGHITDTKKTYEADMLLGVTTDTQDTSGEILSRSFAGDLDKDAIRSCVESFLGSQMQIPPMYSAKKVNGKRLYQLAREGVQVERKPVPVFFYDISLLEISVPHVRFRVVCSKGTYIRTLCHDIGEKLGCGGCMEKLVRTRVGPFRIEDSMKIGELEQAKARGEFASAIIPVDRLFLELPGGRTIPEADRYVHNGNPVYPADLRFEEERTGSFSRVRLYDSEGVFVGIFRLDEKRRIYCPEQMYLDPEQIHESH